MATDTKVRDIISLKGSAQLIQEFFHFGLNNILYLRGIYPADSFEKEKKYGLTMLISKNLELQQYLEPLLKQVKLNKRWVFMGILCSIRDVDARVTDWLENKQLRKLVVAISDLQTKTPVERWQFDIETEEITGQDGENLTKEKHERKIRQEMAEVMRQITASVTFLPLLESPCSFDVLIYTGKEADTPENWAETSACLIKGAEQVQLRSFSTAVHSVHTKKIYLFRMSRIISRILSGFNSTDHGLAADFLLTKLTQMKGCGCKVPRAILLEFLKGLKMNDDGNAIGIGLDSCVIPLRHKGLFLVQTTDFFYPLVDDPYLMGRITCANVLSDLYAMGVVNCDNMLILLGVPKDISDNERDIVVSNFFDGFKDTAVEAGTAIRGGQTVRCPWLLLGGVATSVCNADEMATVDGARPGDVLLLTKALGGQVAVNSYEWLKRGNSRMKELKLDESRIVRAYQQVVEQMCRLNRNAARMTLKYGTHASTDVTGFGILGHADNLAKAQKMEVQFVIHTLPIIDYMPEISKAMGNGFNLFSGTSAETSGGLLIAVEKDKADNLRTELEQLDGFPVWFVGDVVSGPRGAVMAEDVKIISVASKIHPI
ncbi:unnamed protein product [Litomosoides sigmodontis]|uniref:HORMA domain-containing protein n=1 Tax=Litomosoides sigmodontis TaxID=42156 RepID=A0A3P6TCF1_LITSI|nr:unnamed protein product [Litomosoides sigmodontis]